MEAQHIGPYILIKRLGRGGMGAVYEARHGETNDHVAVKVLASHLADDIGLKERFEAASNALTRVFMITSRDPDPADASKIAPVNAIGPLASPGSKNAHPNAIAQPCKARAPSFVSTRGANHMAAKAPNAAKNIVNPNVPSLAPIAALRSGTKPAKLPQYKPTTIKPAAGARDTRRSDINVCKKLIGFQ